MKVDKLIVSAALMVLIGLAAWNLKETVALKVQVAAVAQELHDHINTTQQARK